MIAKTCQRLTLCCRTFDFSRPHRATDSTETHYSDSLYPDRAHHPPLSLLHSSSFTVPPGYLSSPPPLPPREQRAAATAYVSRGLPNPLLPPEQLATTATSCAPTLGPSPLDTASARVCAARVSPSLAASDGGADQQGDSNSTGSLF